MWYFAWALGVSLAASFAILNALWLELDARAAPDQRPEADRGR